MSDWTDAAARECAQATGTCGSEQDQDAEAFAAIIARHAEPGIKDRERAIKEGQRFNDDLEKAETEIERLRKGLAQIASHPDRDTGGPADDVDQGVAIGHRRAAEIAREVLNPQEHDR